MDSLIRTFEEGFESDKVSTLAEVKEGFESDTRRFLARVKEELELEKVRNLAKVEKVLESIKRSSVTTIKRYLKDSLLTPARTNMKLEFRNGITKKILTGHEIKGEEGILIEVALVDDSTGDVVDSGPAASANVGIVLLKGKPKEENWTAEEFNSNIVPEVVGKQQPILAGNLPLQLQKGVAVLDKIYIRHHASTIKPSKFMLGARVVGDFRVREAITEPFILKEYRVKYKEKLKNPSLTDKLWRLVNIGKGGEIEKRLHDSDIYNVKDFLKRLLTNPQGLNKIVNSKAKKWEDTVRNARACVIGQSVYFYMDPEQKKGIIFNILGHVLGLHPNTLAEEHKADLLASAYANWEEVVEFEDQTRLEQHLASLRPYIHPLNPGGDQGNTQDSEMEAELTPSIMNWFEDPGFLPTGADDDLMLNLQLSTTFSEEYNAYFEELQIFSKSKAERGWHMLFFISMWFVKMKRAYVTPSGKKQKIDK